MDAIAGFFSENGVIVLIVILAALGMLWLLSRFFKLTVIIAIIVLAVLAIQHYMPPGDLKTKFKGISDKVMTKGGEVIDGANEFFFEQKGRMQKHMNDALDNGDKKDAAKKK